MRQTSVRVTRSMCPGIVAMSLFFANCSESGPGSFAERQITAESLLADVKVLSSDAMAGRGTGTEGEDRAARFIAEEFAEAGLSPVKSGSETAARHAPTGRPEAYFQLVDLVGMKRKPPSSLRISSQNGPLSFEAEESLTYWSTSQKPVVEISEAPLIFVGYGVEAPEYEWDDFKGANLEGKVLLFLNDDPPVSEEGHELFGGEARTYYGRWTYKFEEAMRRGAAGALIVHTLESASYPFSVVQHAGQGEEFALALPNSGYQVDLLGWIDAEKSDEIARAMGHSLEELFRMAASRDFSPVDTGFRINAHIETAVRRLKGKNVVGIWEGSDSVLKDQIVLFSAHFDHIGTNPELEGKDKIFNGAWDNASGTACLLNLARAVVSVQPRPRRSIAFLACTAEEQGLLGSQWFVNRPPIPLRRIVADYNIDMTQIFGVTSDIGAIGYDTNSLGDDLRQVAQDFPGAPRIVGDSEPGAGRFYRSDQVSFAKQGVPALFIRPGTDYLHALPFDPIEYHREHYHQVSDEVNSAWDLSGAERDMRILFRAALRTANSDQAPHWVSGNEFESAWQELYGK